MWKVKTKDGKEINEQNSSWTDVKDSISELSLVTNDNKIITLPKNMESYVQFKSASANLGSNNINIESRTIGFKLGNNIIKIRVDEKTGNINLEIS
jgi:hypothetical protein